MVPLADPDALSPAELQALVSALLDKAAELERTVAAFAPLTASVSRCD
jgi:hypothetical protein